MNNHPTQMFIKNNMKTITNIRFNGAIAINADAK